MNKKISVGLAISLIAICAAITFAVTMSVAQRTYNKLVSNLSGRTDTYKIISELSDKVAAEYYGSISPEAVNAKTAAGYIEGLNDKYSFYLTAREYSEYETRMSGKTSGIGITTMLDEATGYMRITEVYKGSTADSSNLMKDDFITKIDDEEVTELTYDRLLEVLSGQKLTTVNITYKRGSTTKTINVMLGYSSQSISGELIGDKGYIKISAFYKNTAQQLENIITELTEQGATSLIFDVRNTADGTIECACEVLDVLVPVTNTEDGALATAIYSDTKNNVEESIGISTTSCVTMPMTVLVNSETSGCAELFACDLRDFGLAQLVGETTTGNGTYQKTFELADGSAMVLTVAKIKPYLSESYLDTGVEPDHEVKLEEEKETQLKQGVLAHDTDDQLNAAIELLSNQASADAEQ